MAKGTGLLGLMSGKVGNMVFYALKNSNNGQAQGVRSYQPVVANPQVTAQMTQRIKLKAVNNFYRALKPIINRGFEGVKYGEPSRRKFLKGALGREFNGPFLEKGASVAPPLDGVIISSGSLPELTAEWVTPGGSSTPQLVISVPWTGGGSGTWTVGQVSQAFFEAGFQEDDQITFVECYTRGGAILYEEKSVYLVGSDATYFNAIAFEVAGTISGNLSIEPNHGMNTIGFAVVASREGSHLRSTSRFGLHPQARQLSYYDVSQLDNVIATYLKSENARSTDWQLVAPKSGSAAGFVDVPMGDGLFVRVTGFQTGTNGYLLALDSAGSPTWFIVNAETNSSNLGKWLKADGSWGTPLSGEDDDDVPTLKYEEDGVLATFLINQGYDVE